jgi:hypothetical protein
MNDTQAQNNRNFDQYLSQIRELDIDAVSDALGIKKCSQGYKFNYFNRSILFDRSDFVDLAGGELQPAIKTIFCQYLLNGLKNTMASSGKLVTFREFSGAGPLFSRFCENTNKTIEQSFSNRLAELEEKCRQLFGMPVNRTSYDLSVRFKALPMIPVIFQFNDTDDLLPANSTILFHEDAQEYLDIRSLATIGTYLTGLLIQ